MPLQLRTSRLTPLGFGRASLRPSNYIPPRPPEGPSCSRWLSCTCCRHSQSDNTPGSSRASYFSHNSSYSTKTKTRHLLTLPTLNDTSEPSLSPSSSHHRDNTPRLPLPPTLPYSPDSLPFKRHLEYLSLSVVSSLPETSWRTYLALHPSLRRYIPDNLFRSLLAHQLSDEYPTQRWIRSLALVKFAKRCGVSIKDLGDDNLRNVVEAGLIYVLRTKTAELEKYAPDIEALWQQIKGNRDIPLELRKSWLRYHVKRRIGKKSQRVQAADTALRETAERFGIAGLQKEAGRIVTMYKGSDVGVHLASLERAAWCADRGALLPEDTMLVMLRLIEIWEGEGLDALERLRSSVASLPVSAIGARHLDNTLAQVRHRCRPSAQRLSEAIGSQVSVAHITRLTLDTLGTETPDISAALDALSDLAKRDAETELVFTKILNHLSRSSDSLLILRLAQISLEHDTLQHLRDQTIHKLLRLLLATRPSDEAYSLSRKVYPLARTRSFRWTHRQEWESLFHYSIQPSRRHLHFASRLYADYQADRREILPRDMYAMVRAVGMSRSASRPVLLERYITDFIQLGTPAEPFVLAMVQSLTASKEANDASLALDLARRILQDQPIPPAAAELMIAKLAGSPSLGHLRQAVYLLDFVPTSAAFNNILFSIIAHSRSDPRPGQMSRTEALSQAIVIYKRMIEQDIPITPRTISLLLRALVEARHVTSALGIFRAAMKNGFALKPNSVGRLMVRLILDERFTEARNVERDWRRLASPASGRRYDRAIVGARVLLDTKSGKEVDIARIAQQTGWSGTAPFIRFIESLQPRISTSTILDQHDQVTDVEAAEIKDATEARPAVTDPHTRPWNSGTRSDRSGGLNVDAVVGIRLE